MNELHQALGMHSEVETIRDLIQAGYDARLEPSTTDSFRLFSPR